MEKALVDLLNLLAPCGYEITLVLEEKKGELLSELNPEIRVEEFKVYKDGNVLIRKIRNLVRRRLWIRKNRNRYDFSCAYATYSVIGTRLALTSSINSSIYIHSNYYDVYLGDREKIGMFFTDLLLDKFKHIIFVSEESRIKLQSIYPYIKERGIVINNVIDWRRIRDLAEEKAEFQNPGRRNYLFVGRLEEESKRLSRLIDAFALAYAEDKSLKLYIIGDGKDRELCVRRIEKYGIDEAVVMLGKKNNPYPYIRMADCVLLTSDYEGYPVIYNECLILNTPVITTVAVSDGDVDIREYAQIVNRNEREIADAILAAESKCRSVYSIDFEQLNRKKVQRLIHVIEQD